MILILGCPVFRQSYIWNCKEHKQQTTLWIFGTPEIYRNYHSMHFGAWLTLHALPPPKTTHVRFISIGGFSIFSTTLGREKTSIIRVGMVLGWPSNSYSIYLRHFGTLCNFCLRPSCGQYVIIYTYLHSVYIYYIYYINMFHMLHMFHMFHVKKKKH